MVVDPTQRYLPALIVPTLKRDVDVCPMYE